jgi:periplasmic divalent cation tolerance protein
MILVFVTASDSKEANYIGESLVKERLAACANVIEKVSSVYWWKGKLEKDEEALLILKTKEEMAEKIVNRVKILHSYENPEVICLSISHGSKDYLNWIDEEVG